MRTGGRERGVGRRSEGVFPISVIVLIWLISVAMWLTPGIVLPDGAGYYVYLPSTWFDGDLLFFNEWQRFGLTRQGRILFKEITPTDHLGNHWTVGSALFWYPAFLIGDLTRSLLSSLQSFPRDGVSLPYNVAVATASAVAGLITLLIGWRVALTFSDSFAATMATVGLWLGTPLMWYSIRNSLLAHVISSLACALVVILGVRLRSSQRWSDFLAAGLAAGFAFIVRPQNAPFALIPLLLVPLAQWRSLGRLAGYGCGFLAAALPQLVTSTVLYGNPVRFLAGEPRAGWIFFERIWSWEPVLSWFHGLIPWSPLVVLSIAGWLVLWRGERRLAIAAGFCFASQWLINATMDRSFWGGFAFGQRRFDNCAIFFLIGAAALFTRLPRLLSVSLTILACGWTLSLFVAATSELDLNLYYTPGELLAAQGRAVLSARPEFLQFVPDAMKSRVALVFLATLAGMGTVGAVLYLATRKIRATIPLTVLAWLTLMALGLGFWGNNGLGSVHEYAELIRYNRSPAVVKQLPAWRIELLRQELRYLEKSGRERAAARTRRDLQSALRKF